MKLMKQKFRVEFAFGVPGEGPYVEVWAFTREQAKIIAQADRIKRSLDYEVEHVWSDPSTGSADVPC